MSLRTNIKVKVNVSITSSTVHETVCDDLPLNSTSAISSCVIADNVKCLEAYPTLHKVPNNTTGLYYSDHLAVYALFELDEQAAVKPAKPLENVGIADASTRELLRSACIIVEETIRRIQRQRLYCALVVFVLVFILFSLNGSPLSNSYLFTTFAIVKNLLCLIGIAVCVWFICLGKPVERNALSSVQNAMRVRLRAAHFSY